MQAHPLTRALATGETIPALDETTAAGPRTRPWTVQCSYAAYYANTVVVEAVSPMEACALAIEAANESDGWKSLDHCGPTFVDALSPGQDADPWMNSGSVAPVPDVFTEAGEAPTIVVAVADGAVRDTRIVGSGAPLRLIVLDAPDGAAVRTAIAALGRAPRLPARFQPPSALPEVAPEPARERSYHGHRDVNGDCHVVVIGPDGMRHGLDPRLDLENKSPTGFEWGYGGSGPAQLALALCADALGDHKAALAIYQRFKFNVIARLDRMAPWSMTVSDVRARCAALQCEPR